MSTQVRPTGITVLAIVAAIEGVIQLFGGAGLLFLGGIAAGLTGGATGGLAPLVGIVDLVVGVVFLALAYGFWTLKTWAWVVGAAMAIIQIVLGVIFWLMGYGSILGVGISVVIAAVILWYLMQPTIQSLFGRPAK